MNEKIPRENALKLCEGNRKENKRKWFGFGKTQCSFCYKFGKEDPSMAPSVNIWDNGYPSGGNYWSNYNGTDNDNDGVGDTPYVIYANNTDRYPLMKPLTISETPNVPETPPVTPPSTNPPVQQQVFLGSSLPMQYGYATLAVIVVAIAVATGYLYLKRKK